ncbi:hypothetical protein GCM10009105_37660 [Dokdonella soli]|uniref:Uncharacterized protein n=2 Tax=Dokdonella soli TaxID=529810 RepID=A0ABN1J0B2_9GAMM
MLDPRSLGELSSADGIDGPNRCRVLADRLFRHVIELGTSRVADFGAMVSCFYMGRLLVEIADGERIVCTNAFLPTPLLGKALADAARSAVPETFVRQDASGRSSPGWTCNRSAARTR